MKVLRELFPFVDQAMVVQIIAKQQTPKNVARVRTLLERLADSPDTNRAEMVRLLYGKSRSETHEPFQKLIYLVTQVVLVTFLRPDARITATPSRLDMIQRCERAFALLYMTAEQNTHTKLIYWQQLVVSLQECHHVALEIECLEVMHMAYGYRAYDADMLRQSEINIRQAIARHRAGIDCKMAAMDYRRLGTGQYPPLIPADRVSAAVAAYEMYDVQYYGGELLAQMSLDREDWPAVLQITEQALNFFEEAFAGEKQPLVHFSYIRLLAFIALQEFERGWEGWLTLYRHLPGRMPKASSQTSKVFEVAVLLILRCGAEAAIPDLLVTFNDSGGIQRVPANDRGRWLTYLESLELLNNNRPDVTHQLLKLKRQIGEPSLISREDQLHRQIIACFRLLSTQHYRKVAVLISEISQRQPKRLSSKSPDYRLQLFIKLLMESGNANFHRAATLRKTKATLARFRKTRPAIDGDGVATELIAFEHLWEILLNYLTDKAPRRPYMPA